ncbi:hypothetical protein GZH53_12845 [Flavihumibacter sp. R14]|nr:hypothetical protein [Flavihumibacter soli]
MKKLFTLLAFAACVSLATAQTSPKADVKAETKKECKKGDKCCSKESKEKTASADTKSKAPKKN